MGIRSSCGGESLHGIGILSQGRGLRAVFEIIMVVVGDGGGFAGEDGHGWHLKVGFEAEWCVF